MEKLIELWSKHLGSPWLIPVTVAVALPWLIKGMFSLHRSKSQDRRDFLDLWTKRDQADDLWLQVAVRHVYGAYLPVAVLRYLIGRPQGGRALCEVSEAWSLVDWDDASNELFWRDPRHFLKSKRVRAYWLSLVGYFVSAGVTLGGSWLVLSGHAQSSWVEWTYLLAGAGVTGHLLARQELLRIGEEVVPRWLGQMRWRGGSCNHEEQNETSSRRRRPKRSKRLERESR